MELAAVLADRSMRATKDTSEDVEAGRIPTGRLVAGMIAWVGAVREVGGMLAEMGALGELSKQQRSSLCVYGPGRNPTGDLVAGTVACLRAM